MARALALGWRVAVRLELTRGERWVEDPDRRKPSLTYTAARELADRFAREGRRVRLIDPEGRHSSDVPPPEAETALRLEAPPSPEWWHMPP